MTSSRRLLVLTYHRVLAEPDPLFPARIDRRAFERQLQTLRRGRFRVLRLEEAWARMQKGSLPRRAVVITFDDGYADNLHIASPLLRSHGFPAMVFVAPGFLDGGLMWNDVVIESVRRTGLDRAQLDVVGIDEMDLSTIGARQRAIAAIIKKIKYFPQDQRLDLAHQLAVELGMDSLPDDLMLTTHELRELHGQGFDVGGHTLTHPILEQLKVDQARAEIVNCRSLLADILDADIRCFAYPNGKPGKDYSSVHVEAVRGAGFEIAVSTAWAPVRRSDDPLQLPRVGFSEHRFLPLAARLMRSYWEGPGGRV